MTNLQKQNNLQKLEDCIKELVPEIMELKMGCIVRKIKSRNKPLSFRCPVEIIVEQYNTLIEEDKLHFRCDFDYYDGEITLKKDYEVLGRPITLEDVLMALQKKELNIDREFERCCLVTCDKELDNGIIEIAELEWRGIKAGTEIKWQLGKPLSEQSEETVNNLLKIFEV